jgi:hypothetical protein
VAVAADLNTALFGCWLTSSRGEPKKPQPLQKSIVVIATKREIPFTCF